MASEAELVHELQAAVWRLRAAVFTAVSTGLPESVIDDIIRRGKEDTYGQHGLDSWRAKMAPLLNHPDLDLTGDSIDDLAKEPRAA